MDPKEFQTIREALAYCIDQEHLSYEQYSRYAKRTLNLRQKSIWEQLANDELRHKALLSSLLDNHQFLSMVYATDTNLPRLDIYEIEKPVNPVKEIFMRAINAEIEAYNGYRDIAQQSSATEMKNLFHLLSQEELVHKQALEEELATLE
jgi:rubrerythrin